MHGSVAVQPRKKSDLNNEETILEVRHWTDKLFSFRTTRDRGFRFASGQLRNDRPASGWAAVTARLLDGKRPL